MRCLTRLASRLALLALVLVASGCSKDSYLLVTLLSGDTAFSDLSSVKVHVEQSGGSPARDLTYATTSAHNSFDVLDGLTLSVSFTPSRSGDVSVTVQVFQGTTCVGEGKLETTIIKEAVKPITVVLQHTTACAIFDSDGGTGPDAADQDGGDAGTDGNVSDAVVFPGCEPATAAGCSAGQTCYVNCQARAGMCIAGGAQGPGSTCASNNDCMPGTQCFDYSGILGCSAGTKACLRFCQGDTECQPLGAGSTCRNPVICDSTTTTAYKTCSFACDPRGDATMGCAPGLACFLFQNPDPSKEDLPDCSCRDPSRTRTDGMACARSADCAPGLICNMMAGTMACRRLCKMSEPANCGTATCAALANSTTYGVCIPPP